MISNYVSNKDVHKILFQNYKNKLVLKDIFLLDYFCN